MASYHTLHSLCMFDIQHNKVIQQKTQQVFLKIHFFKEQKQTVQETQRL